MDERNCDWGAKEKRRKHRSEKESGRLFWSETGGRWESRRREGREKRFREHVRRCSCGGRPVVDGINTAFNVGRRRSWTPRPSRRISPRRTRGPAASSGSTFVSLFPVIAPDPTPRPPPTEGSLLFLRSAIQQIAIDTDDPLFLFFSSSPCLVPSLFI